MVSICAVLFPRDVLDNIVDLIELVSEGFPTYSFIYFLNGWLVAVILCLFFSTIFQSYQDNGGIMMKGYIVMYKTIYVINIIIYMCSQHSNVL